MSSTTSGPPEGLGVEDGACPGQPHVGLVGEDPEDDPPAGDLGDPVGDRLGHGVDRVGAHRVTDVDDQVGDDVRLVFEGDRAHQQVAHSTADLGELGVLGGGELHQLGAGLEQA